MNPNRNVFIRAADTRAVLHMHMSNTMVDAQKVNCLIVFALQTQWNVMFGRFADGVDLCRQTMRCHTYFALECFFFV